LDGCTPKVIEKKKKEELKAICRANGITNYASKNREELIKMITKTRNKLMKQGKIVRIFDLID
jgi:hypothetical protein